MDKFISKTCQSLSFFINNTVLASALMSLPSPIKAKGGAGYPESKKPWDRTVSNLLESLRARLGSFRVYKIRVRHGRDINGLEYSYNLRHVIATRLNWQVTTSMFSVESATCSTDCPPLTSLVCEDESDEDIISPKDCAKIL